MVAVAVERANKVRDLPANAMSVRCQSATCGRKPDDRAVLFQVEKGSTGTVFKVCDRCHHWNIVVLDILW